MADQIPLKTNYTGSDATSLGEFASGDTVPVANGGTGATTASAARTALGLASAAFTNAVQTFTAAQRGTQTVLTDGATITPDFSVTNNYLVTLGGNRTLANPSNLSVGQSGVIMVLQDATGGRTLAFGSQWKFKTGTAPTLTATASAVDMIAYYVDTTSTIRAVFIGDVR